jgi:hypothetical protein
MDRLTTRELANGSRGVLAREDDQRDEGITISLSSAGRHAEIVATQADPNVTRLDPMVHIVIVPKRHYVVDNAFGQGTRGGHGIG